MATNVEFIKSPGSDPVQSAINRRQAVEDYQKSVTPEDQAYDQAMAQAANIQASQLWAEQHSLDLVKHIAPTLNELQTIPEHIRKQFWSVLGPGLSTSFNTEKDKIDLDLSLGDLRISYNMNKPPRKVRPEELLQIDNIEIEALNNFKRSIGIKDNSTNFLKLIFTNIQQIISSSFSGSVNKQAGINIRDIQRKFG